MAKLTTGDLLLAPLCVVVDDDPPAAAPLPGVKLPFALFKIADAPRTILGGVRGASVIIMMFLLSLFAPASLCINIITNQELRNWWGGGFMVSMMLLLIKILLISSSS